METIETKVRIKKAARAAARGVTLVEVLIVLAIMALIAGSATLLVFPALTKARVQTAVLDGMTIKKAAEMHQNLDGTADSCPSIEELVKSRKIDDGRTNDPWGKPYKITCEGDDIHVVSSGKDRKEGSEDDVRDDFKKSDIEKVANMK